MAAPSAVAIIPARLRSQRLPGKALEDLNGLPMVVHVLRRVRLAARVADVVVATDDESIAAAVRVHGGAALMTSPHHVSGTDRVAEAARQLALGPGAVVVNVQGDEPLVEPDTLDRLCRAMDDPLIDVATVAAPFPDRPGEGPLEPSRVKVVCDRAGRALYFSRAPVPSGGPWWLHLGLYAFRMDALQRFTSLPPGALERSERLEQLRFLEHGMAIRVVDVDSASPSVDTPDDLARVRRLLGCRPRSGET